MTNAVLTVALAGAVLAQGQQQDTLNIPHCSEGHCTLAPFEADELARQIAKAEHLEGHLQAPRPAGRTLAAVCTAYAYTGSRTRTGTVPVFGTVAVDPSVIPLDSQLLVAGFPGTVFRAEDTGGGVLGAHVDIYLGSHSEAIQFGRQDCTVTVLR